MKKICILSSGGIEKFYPFRNYFENNSNISVDFITDNPDSESDWIKYFSEKDLKEELTKYDIIAIYDCNADLNKKLFSSSSTFLNVHKSLLPAFDTDNALEMSFKSGIKVGGITIHLLKEQKSDEKIIAQYPVLISNLTHFDEYKTTIENLINLLYPIVIEKIAEDKIFDFEDLFRGHSGGCGNCGGSCGGCSH